MKTAPAKILFSCLLALFLTLGPGMHMLAMAAVSHHAMMDCDTTQLDSGAEVPTSSDAEDIQCTGNCICTQMSIALTLPYAMHASEPPTVIQGLVATFTGQPTTPDPYPPKLQ